MVVVRMTEMYDMCTTKGKIGLIGIHTPSADGMAKRWKGLFDNHRYYKLLGCDVKVACASVLPVDPLQVGTEANDIAPQDMMNPLLYTTMTNEGWNVLLNRLFTAVGTGEIDTASVRGIPNALSSLSDDVQEAFYYQMLSSDKFRKAMPQNGLTMRNVKPFVHQIVSTFGQMGSIADESQQGTGKNGIVTTASGTPTSTTTAHLRNMVIRGKAQPYPRLPCSLPGSTPGTGDYPVPNGVPLLDVYTPFKTMCACIVLPPAKLHEFYFRMLVSWKIAFMQPCTMMEKTQPNQYGDTTDIYYRGYSYSSAKDIDADELSDDDHTDSVASVDALNMAPSLVMEK